MRLTWALRRGGAPGRAHLHEKKDGCVQNVHLTRDAHLVGVVVRMRGDSADTEERADFQVGVQRNGGALCSLLQVALAVQAGKPPTAEWKDLMSDFKQNGIGQDIFPSFLFAVVTRLLAEGHDFNGHFSELQAALQAALEAGDLGHFKLSLTAAGKAVHKRFHATGGQSMLDFEQCVQFIGRQKITKIKLTVHKECLLLPYTLPYPDDAPVCDDALCSKTHVAPARSGSLVPGRMVLANEAIVALCDGLHIPYVKPQFLSGITFLPTKDAKVARTLELAQSPAETEVQVRPHLSRDTGSVQ
jgi:hypothetical protein